LPPIIRNALATTTLLFIGYKLEDINFRVTFRHLLDALGARFQSLSIAVLLPSGFTEEKKDKALQYLNNYTKNMFKIDVYWGDALEFAAELRKRLDEFRNAKY
jgi:hypothetical protein